MYVFRSDFCPVTQSGKATSMKINIHCWNTYIFFETGAGQMSVCRSFNFLASRWPEAAPIICCFRFSRDIRRTGFQQRKHTREHLQETGHKGDPMHYAAVDTSPEQNPAKLFCPDWLSLDTVCTRGGLEIYKWHTLSSRSNPQDQSVLRNSLRIMGRGWWSMSYKLVIH